jgi:hypothetical protein
MNMMVGQLHCCAYVRIRVLVFLVSGYPFLPFTLKIWAMYCVYESVLLTHCTIDDVYWRRRATDIRYPTPCSKDWELLS